MLEYSDIAHIVKAIAPRIEGGRVQKIRQPDPETVVLSVHRTGETVHLVLSCQTSVSRIAETPRPGPTLPAPTALGAWLRSIALGRRLRGLRVDEQDRIVLVHFDDGHLIAELWPHGGNLAGVDVQHRVVALARQNPQQQRLRTGGLYVRPVLSSQSARMQRFRSGLDVERAAQGILASALEGENQRRTRMLLKRARKRLARLRRHVEADQERALKAQEFKRLGDLLKGELYSVEAGATEAWVTDWNDPNQNKVCIPLQRGLSPGEQVDFLFRKYKRAKQGLIRASARLDEVVALENQLMTLVEDTDSAGPLAEQLLSLGLIQERQAPRGPKVSEIRLPYRAFTSKASEQIYVGRGGVDNHVLTFRIAKGKDHWLHVRDAAGAHVIVPLPRRGATIHPETLLDAAALAVHHSRLRGEESVDVTHTQRQHVRAIRGGPPGQVTIAGAKTLRATQVEARIQRLYAHLRHVPKA